MHRDLHIRRIEAHALFPLPPDIWVDWIQQATAEEVSKLFNESLLDGFMPQVHFAYLNRLTEASQEEFEHSLSLVALDPIKAASIWALYRKVHPSLSIDLYLRQLSIPHISTTRVIIGIEDTFNEFKMLEIDEASLNEGKRRFETSLAEMEKRMPFEEACIMDPNSKKRRLILDSQNWLKYIDAFLTSNPSRIKCLYERALIECPVDLNLWLHYVRYLKKNLNMANTIIPVIHRATRFIPSSFELWKEKLSINEHHGASISDLHGILHAAKQSFCPADAISLQFIYCMSRMGAPVEQISSFAHQELSCVDDSIRILIAEIAVQRGNAEYSIKLWEDIIASNASESWYWLEYISQVKYLLKPAQISSLYKRAISSCHDKSSVAHSWMMYEEKYGTPQSLWLAAERLEKESKETQEAEEQEEKKKEDKNGKKREFQDEEKKSKKKLKESISTIFISNLPFSATEASLLNFLLPDLPSISQIRLVKDSEGKSKGYGYVDLSSEDDYKKAMEMDRVNFEGRPLFISKNEPNRKKQSIKTEVKPALLVPRQLIKKKKILDLK